MEALSTVPSESGYVDLTLAERATLQQVERFGASLSLVGVVFIFVAYGLSKRVRSVPNTFIVFASIANAGASVACLIGYAGILAGDSSALCQAQAFLLEMFMQSDPWWSFAMAVNVYMVFFMGYPLNNFHKRLWLYCLVCFGIPALPALVCLFYAPNGQHIYGNATLWCWIDDTYNQLRIFTYYLPIWMCILLSAVIYVAVGYHVFHQRNQLRNLTLSNQENDVSADTDLRYSAENVGFQRQLFRPPASSPVTSQFPLERHGHGGCGIVTTEVQVTAESSDSQSPLSTPTTSIAPVLHKPQPAAPPHPWVSPDRDVRPASPTTGGFTRPSWPRSSVTSRKRQQGKRRDNKLTRTWREFTHKLHKLDPVKLAYLRTPFVFAISVLVTWTPSSINRVYSLLYPSRTSYALNLASAIVLPLQGLWNAVIFAATSWKVLQEEFCGLMAGWRPGRLGSRRLSEDPGKHMAASGFGVGRAGGPENRELAPAVHLSNVRVIRGGSL
ncbi:hypothetical protein VTK56DRAFT_7229 [Thermocarpiscus australiensis]